MSARFLISTCMLKLQEVLEAESTRQKTRPQPPLFFLIVFVTVCLQVLERVWIHVSLHTNWLLWVNGGVWVLIKFRSWQFGDLLFFATFKNIDQSFFRYKEFKLLLRENYWLRAFHNMPRHEMRHFRRCLLAWREQLCKGKPKEMHTVHLERIGLLVLMSLLLLRMLADGKWPWPWQATEH